MCYSDEMKTKNRVIIPVNLKPYPTVEEVSAAYILAEYFGCDVEFVMRRN